MRITEVIENADYEYDAVVLECWCVLSDDSGGNDVVCLASFLFCFR